MWFQTLYNGRSEINQGPSGSILHCKYFYFGYLNTSYSFYLCRILNVWPLLVTDYISLVVFVLLLHWRIWVLKHFPTKLICSVACEAFCSTNKELRESHRQPITNLRGEDVVGHIPDPLVPLHLGVAHPFHFGIDRADCCVGGLVAFLIDEHPPVDGTQGVSELSAPQTRTLKARPTPAHPIYLLSPTGRGMSAADGDAVHAGWQQTVQLWVMCVVVVVQ